MSVSHFDFVSKLIKFPAHIPLMKPDLATSDDIRVLNNIYLHILYYIHMIYGHIIYTLHSHASSKDTPWRTIDIRML